MAGLLGGFHCMAMCGGYVSALATGSTEARVPILHARRLFVRQAVSNIARLSTYAGIGAIFGAAGGAALGSDWMALQRFLYVGANLLLLVLAIAVASGRSPFAIAERAGLAVYRRLLPATAGLGRGGGLGSRVALGFLWGMTPCGLVYSVLPVAMLSGSAADGALVMLLFGLGTLPNLLAIGYFAGRAGPRLRAPAWRYAGAAVIAAFAIMGLYRAVFVPQALAHGPFCIVP
jgi:sulfite exporter TauE/SafE